MAQKASTVANTLIEARIVKKCDRTYHKPETNKACTNGTCQHTCDPAQVEDCAHKWTVRYSVSSRQREQSFKTHAEAEAFQLTLAAGKLTDGDAGGTWFARTRQARETGRSHRPMVQESAP